MNWRKVCSTIAGTGSMAASSRGIMGGDVLLSIDRQPVNSVVEVQGLLDNKDSGSAVLFMVMRDGTTHFIGMEIP